ncbi:type VI secretion system baseplate subunit TssE [Roseibium polysiphoniae]|nr:type VI secretion system baseplate subunit TssE [Roseibium polysiphoniae]MBS8262596.1 type VI secretion system baseplate subunit TssE [Roseibium polysiphoniae]
MISVSLLQRLEEDLPNYAGSTTSQAENALMDSILFNLRMLLNSNAGCCETRADYGLADFNARGQSHRDTADALCRDIERQIRMFEPRLRNAMVRVVEDAARPLEFIFSVEADLAYPDRSVRVRFDSVLGSDGQVRLNV